METNNTIDRQIYILLNLIADKNHEETGYKQLGKYLNGSKKPKEDCKIFLIKLLDMQFRKYAETNLFKIYKFLFNKMKNIKLSLDDDIFFTIINSLFIFPHPNEIDKVNTIIKIIKDEKIFILKNFDKLLNKIIIPLITKNEEPIKTIGYYLDQIVKDGIGSLFQKNINEDKEKDKLNKEYNLIYLYLIKKLQEVKILPRIQELIISWLVFLESIPEKDLSQHYYEIIIQLLRIINSDNKEASELSELNLKKIIDVILFSYNDEKWRFMNTVKCIINLIIDNNYQIYHNEHYEIVIFEILNKLLEKFELKIKMIRKNSDKKLEDYIPFELFPDILNFILETLIELNKAYDISDQNEHSNIYPMIKANLIFSDIIKNTEPEFFKEVKFKNVINRYLLNYLDEKCTKLIFDWIYLLYSQKLFQNDEFIINLIIEMKELKDFHIKRIFEIIYMIKNNSKETNQKIIKKIMIKFHNEEFLDEFGVLILNILSDESNKIIDIIDIFKEIINYMKSQLNIYYIINIINFLSKYLITEKTANKIIYSLNSDNNFFRYLYEFFCFNPFDTLVLLLLSKKFELSYFFVLNLSKKDLDASDYIELSKCVQIFESIYFIDVRIQLLNPKSNIYLTKTMYAISLLLPPGPALDSLNQRLQLLEILFKFDEEEQEIKIENDNDNYIDDINNDDSSKKSDFDFNNESSTSYENENFNEILKQMDEKERITFEKIEIKELIDIFYKKQRIRKEEVEKKNKGFKTPSQSELNELDDSSFYDS